ncbi:MAG: hypothetical protein D6735_09440 [Acidobacteria bacterium]|nr:MAG: hypothetical protein D6735_09440 [Acidobacteriota bacterium]
MFYVHRQRVGVSIYKERKVMRTLARKSFFLALAGVIVSFSHVQPQVSEKATMASADKVMSSFKSDIDLRGESKFDLRSEEKKSILFDKAATRTFTATAYCLKGKTASGRHVRKGIIAADPRVLPLGSVVQIDAGSYTGTYIVADTGSKVKGNKIDVWVPKCSEATRFGKRLVKLTVVSKAR